MDKMQTHELKRCRRLFAVGKRAEGAEALTALLQSVKQRQAELTQQYAKDLTSVYSDMQAVAEVLKNAAGTTTPPE